MFKKVTIVGDPQLPSKYIYGIIKKLESYGLSLACHDWLIDTSLEEFANIVLDIERGFINKYPPPENIIEDIITSEILIVHYAPVPREVIEKSKKLKIICSARGGVDNIDVEYAKKREILILRALGRNANAVADLTMGFIIALNRQILHHHLSIKKGFWPALAPEELPHDLCEMVLGLVGFGQVAREVAKRAKAFGMTILGFDPYVESKEFNNAGVIKSDLECLLKNSDFVSLHARLTPETRNLIGEKELRLMKKTAYLINTSRGELVNEPALIKALSEGWIAGAGLDVFTEEPIQPNHPFLKLDNVLLTPHIAGFTWEGQFLNGPKIILQQLEEILKSKETH
jgi:D-3-phosphoglycerate dehydrogenase